MRSIFFLYFLLLPAFAFSQTDSTNLDALFDDGNISTAKNVLKVSFTSLPAGDLPIYFERVIFKRLSVEVGVGYLIDKPLYELTLPIEIPRPAQGTGYSLWINPRYYLSKAALEGGFFGFQYRLRNYNSGRIQRDYVLNAGFQLTIKRRILFEFMYGMGFRLSDGPESTGPYDEVLENFAFIYPASIKLGIKF